MTRMTTAPGLALVQVRDQDNWPKDLDHHSKLMAPYFLALTV